MHELSLASAILDTIRGETGGGKQRPVRLGLRIGAISGVDAEALRFGFESLVKGSDLDGLALEIEAVAHRRHCSPCDRAFEAAEFDVSCPRCGEPRTTLVEGDQMEISWLEVEDA